MSIAKYKLLENNVDKLKLTFVSSLLTHVLSKI